MAMRDETLQKDKNSASMKMKELKSTIDERIEGAIIDKTIEFEEDAATLNALPKDQLIDKLQEILVSKGQVDAEACKNFDSLRNFEKDYANKVRELEAIEEKFNQCVAIIPETDESTIRLTHEITKLKEQLDVANKEFSESRESLNKIAAVRKDKFLGFFDKISSQLPNNYRELTQSAGTANLLIADRTDKPFESQIIFDFCPPGKRHGVDLDLLSGGEKTIAALAFVFSMVQITRPSLLLMDEVDAFLDAENVELVSEFLQKKLNLFSLPSQQATQVLLVSHKEDLASQMDSLIGVCMLKQHETSKAYSVNLAEAN